MKFWCGTAFMSTPELPAVARMLDEAGYHGIVVSDHLIHPRELSSPTGITWFGPEVAPRSPARAAEALYNVVYTNTHEHGGHFAPVEQPAAVIADIRATFRQLRG